MCAGFVTITNQGQERDPLIKAENGHQLHDAASRHEDGGRCHEDVRDSWRIPIPQAARWS